jgi:hypothetical protein
MSKIDVLQPVQRQRVAPSAAMDIEFILNYFSSAVSQGVITFKLSDTKDFSSAVTIITPASLQIYNGSAYTTYANGKNIQTADLGKKFKYTHTLPTGNKVRYLRIVVTEGSNVYESGTIVITSVNKIDFQLSNPEILNDMPMKVKVTDKKEVVGTGVSFSVQVCNNAFDVIPAWEDMTTAYLNGDFYEFANTVKTAGAWGINVRIIITKTNYSSTVEFNEVYIAHV